MTILDGRAKNVPMGIFSVHQRSKEVGTPIGKRDVDLMYDMLKFEITSRDQLKRGDMR